VFRYQKGKSNLDFTEARDSEWQWYKLGYMQVCTSLQTDNHASTPPLLLPNQQSHCNEGKVAAVLTAKGGIAAATYRINVAHAGYS